ncbi:hypothetical protein [Roseobacter ponti]|uniref:DUF1127 domain-containing protein n=1 Tax=Roseobacter ponti TaxID=1891787 RepID=A0A858SYA9_9RHOB|nr:hypothetical protein [Roseobacter ponti]QJF52643.1 hypothetical protein G3256_16430 [Roseobacter ponti]
MADIQTNALRRAGALRAKIRHIIQKAGLAVTFFRRDPRHNLPDLDDRMARDAGIDRSDLEWRRLKLPSQHSHHPRG